MEPSEDLSHIVKLKSRLKVWAVIQIIVALLAAAFTIIILTQISPLIQQKHQLEQELHKLQQSKFSLNNDINQLMLQKQNVENELRNKQLALNQAVALLNQQQSQILVDKQKFTDVELKQSLVPDTSADLLATAPDGGKTFLFKLWLNAPDNVKRQISRVDYFFNHPSFGNEKTMSSQNAADNFLVQYEGWGCLSLVVITVFPREGKPFDIYFDMCARLRAKRQ